MAVELGRRGYGLDPLSTQSLVHRPLSCKFGGGQIGTARSGPWVLLRGTTRRPSACGSPRVHTSLPPREDHASNLVGPVRGIIGLVRRRRLFRAVRHIGRK